MLFSSSWTTSLATISPSVFRDAPPPSVRLLDCYLLVLGQAVVPLMDACGDKPVKFDVDIFHYGSVHGRVSGLVHLTKHISVADKLSIFAS